MRAIILAAGVGKRLQTITDHRPKCLIQISGKTLLERTLTALGAAGVTEAVVVIGYRGDMIVEEIGEAVWRGGRALYPERAVRKGRNPFTLERTPGV